jgi:hypothetical protein
LGEQKRPDGCSLRSDDPWRAMDTTVPPDDITDVVIELLSNDDTRRME